MNRKNLIFIKCVILILALAVFDTSAYAAGDLGQIVRLKRVAKKLSQKALYQNAQKFWKLDHQAELGPYQNADDYPGVLEDPTKTIPLPDVLKNEILSLLSSSTERCATSYRLAYSSVMNHVSKQMTTKWYQHYLSIRFNRFLPQFIPLPQVTAQEARQLGQVLAARGEGTSIQAEEGAAADAVVIPAFKIADVKNSVGLYRAVMGSYPDLTRCHMHKPYGNYNAADAQAQYRFWDANPDSPLVCTTSTMDVAFAAKLSQITGRRISIATNRQNEYSIRGRELNAQGKAVGAISTSKYYFGDSDDEVKSHAFICTNPLTQERTHGVHEIPEMANPDDYKNAFGLYHPIGNVWVRSAEDEIRGGAFNLQEGCGESSLSSLWIHEMRTDTCGSRLVEAI